MFEPGEVSMGTITGRSSIAEGLFARLSVHFRPLTSTDFLEAAKRKERATSDDGA